MEGRERTWDMVMVSTQAAAGSWELGKTDVIMYVLLLYYQE